ncbi:MULTISPECIES: hypothetical protein [unclassified Paenibacillus]|uniref:hypothetical protein n=1 Tax=unclassified Paenibacillus TaxID=185978 RepID=UPI0036D3C0D1
MIRHGLIDNPYFSHNDLQCRWVEEKRWYRTFDYVKGDAECLVQVYGYFLVNQIHNKGYHAVIYRCAG